MHLAPVHYRAEGWYTARDRWVFLGSYPTFAEAEGVASNTRLHAEERRVMLGRTGTDLYVELCVWSRDDLVLHK